MNLTNKQINDKLQICLEDACNLSELVEICEQNNLSTEAMNIVFVAFESMYSKYNSVDSLGLESNETFTDKIKRIAKAIIQAILNTIDKILANFNYYRFAAESILSELQVIHGRLAGITSIRRRDVTIISQRLASSLYMSKGGGNLQEAYRRLVNLSGAAYHGMNYAALATLLDKLKTAEDSQVDSVVSEIKKELLTPIEKIMTPNGVPVFLKDMYSDSDYKIYQTGPHPGERYIYAIIPNSDKNISGYKIGVARNMEVIPDRERLPALSANEIWEISKIAESFAHEIIEFGRLHSELKKIAESARDIGKDAKSIKAITATAIYPIAVKGIQYSTMDTAIDTTKDILDYCKRSIKAFKEFDSKKKAESEQ